MPKEFSYSKEEVDNFLDAIKEVLSISLTARDRVAEVHLLRYTDLNWTMDSLKRLFKELHNKKIPTGDPLCPPAVCRAKHLRREIINRLDASDLNLEEGEENLEEGQDIIEFGGELSLRQRQQSRAWVGQRGQYQYYSGGWK
jgi:hypothetical protein